MKKTFANKTFLLCSIVCLVAAFGSCDKKEPIDAIITVAKPNILLIIADDVGLDATPNSAISGQKPIMPNLLKLQQEGLQFNNLWSNPTCTPTRATILTGKYAFRTNMTSVGDELATSETSLQQLLQSKNTGYSTAVIGKWHLSNDANHPMSMGVGHYEGLLSGTAQSYTNWSYTKDGQTTTSTDYITTKFSDAAIDWLDQQTTPWFLWLAYTAPHTPFHLPPSHLHTQTGLVDDASAIAANPLPYYLAALEAMDTEMGRVIASMSEGEKENTIIIFIGDNGSPNQVAQTYNSNRVKGTVYQGGVNVPMVIAGKGVGRLNETEDALINTTDLFATIANLAGIDSVTIHDSQNFANLLTNASNPSRKYTYAEIGSTTGSGDYTIRNATHKYIRFEDGSESLFDLIANPLERPDLLQANQLPLNVVDSVAKAELLLQLTIIGK